MPPSPSTVVASEHLRSALDEANIPTLVLVLAHLTGEGRWLRPPYQPELAKGPGDSDSGGLPDEVQAEIRDSVAELVADLASGKVTAAQDPTPERVVEMLGQALRLELPAEVGPLVAEEMGLISRRVDVPAGPAAQALDTVIIGSGFSGLCAAIELKHAGIPYTIIEKNSELGGTWRDNTYPGCGVDTPSHLYSFSFEQRADWPRYFAKQQQLRDYLHEVSDAYGITDHIRFGHEVEAADWDSGAQRWNLVLRTADGEQRISARVLISAVGLMSRPAFPRIAGLDSFAGPAFHTAQWRSDVHLRGKRVAVLGTGASAMQLVPAIAGIPSKLSVFQRSPQWALPNPNYKREVPEGVQQAMRDVPHYAAWYRAQLVWNFGERLHPALQIDPDWQHPDRSINEISERHRRFLTSYLESELGERTDLLEKCLPTYPPYGKRPLLDNGWFRTVGRDDVELITDDVVEIRPHGVVTADGVEHPVDVLVIATGFRTLNMLGPMTITGRSGRTLRDTWGDDDARAHLGISVPDFPNLFLLFGPNTNAGHGGSHVMSVEIQVRYIMDLLAQMAERELVSATCRQDVHDEYNERLDAALEGTIWTHKGMTTYYRNSKGRIVANMPWTNAQYWQMTRHADLGEYEVR